MFVVARGRVSRNGSGHRTPYSEAPPSPRSDYSWIGGAGEEEHYLLRTCCSHLPCRELLRATNAKKAATTTAPAETVHQTVSMPRNVVGCCAALSHLSFQFCSAQRHYSEATRALSSCRAGHHSRPHGWNFLLAPPKQSEPFITPAQYRRPRLPGTRSPRRPRHCGKVP